MIQLELPDALLDALEARMRVVVREELAEHTSSVSPWLDAEGAADYCSMTVEAGVLVMGVSSVFRTTSTTT